MTPEWTLPWEHTLRMRPWMQPFVYVVVGRALGFFGVHSMFALATFSIVQRNARLVREDKAKAATQAAKT